MYDTLEEAQARIVELDEIVENKDNEIATLSQNNTDLNAENEKLRTLNQKYFNKLIAQEDDGNNNDDDDESEEVPTCEEFAMNIDI